MLVLLVMTAQAVEHRITWYLAVDQFGYLTFAHDLMRGRVFHRWPPIEALTSALPPRVDVLVQTYVLDHGVLYCRYAPGFAMLLAGWLHLFGDDGAHFLNPTIFIALLVLAFAFQARAVRSHWRAAAGVALLVLLSSSTLVFFWALTLVRDLATHLTGLLGLFLLLPVTGTRLTPRRAATAGVALGFAASIRPDAALYFIPGLLLAALRWHRERQPRRAVGLGLAAGVLGLLIGLAPFFAYNWAAMGHPLRPTQGMEIQDFVQLPWSQPPVWGRPAARVGYPPGAWLGGTYAPVQGGGLKLSNLPDILPGNVRHFRDAYGDVLLGLALLGAVVAMMQRTALFVAAVPYALLALLFYSCWSKPDPRYFAGVHVFVPMLIVEGAFGTLDVVRKLWRAGAGVTARAVAVAFAAVLFAAAMLIDVPSARSALATVAILLPAVVIVSALAAATWPGRRVTAIAAPVLALALIGFASQRAAAGLKSRATFQRTEMLRAKATFAKAVEPGAVVITLEDIGRPAENIEYYSGVAHAFYLTDLKRWRMTIGQAAELLLAAGLKPYVLMPTGDAARPVMVNGLRKRFAVDLVTEVPPERAIDYFVAAAFHRGLALSLYRISNRTPG